MLNPKTVLLHLNDRRRAKSLLDAVLPAARRWGAHVIGVGALPPAVVLGAGMPGAPSPIILDQARRDAAAIANFILLPMKPLVRARRTQSRNRNRLRLER